MLLSENVFCLMITLGKGFGGIARGGDMLPSVLEDVVPLVGVVGKSTKYRLNETLIRLGHANLKN